MPAEPKKGVELLDEGDVTRPIIISTQSKTEGKRKAEADTDNHFIFSCHGKKYEGNSISNAFANFRNGIGYPSSPGKDSGGCHYSGLTHDEIQEQIFNKVPGLRARYDEAVRKTEAFIKALNLSNKTPKPGDWVQTFKRFFLQDYATFGALATSSALTDPIHFSGRTSSSNKRVASFDHGLPFEGLAAEGSLPVLHNVFTNPQYNGTKRTCVRHGTVSESEVNDDLYDFDEDPGSRGLLITERSSTVTLDLPLSTLQNNENPENLFEMPMNSQTALESSLLPMPISTDVLLDESTSDGFINFGSPLQDFNETKRLENQAHIGSPFRKALFVGAAHCGMKSLFASVATTATTQIMSNVVGENPITTAMLENRIKLHMIIGAGDKVQSWPSHEEQTVKLGKTMDVIVYVFGMCADLEYAKTILERCPGKPFVVVRTHLDTYVESFMRHHNVKDAQFATDCIKSETDNFARKYLDKYHTRVKQLYVSNVHPHDNGTNKLRSFIKETSKLTNV